MIFRHLKDGAAAWAGSLMLCIALPLLVVDHSQVKDVTQAQAAMHKIYVDTLQRQNSMRSWKT